MDVSTVDERQLVPVWSYRLVALSYCISWLGAYTSTQIVIHAKYSRGRLARWIWILMASVAFGFTAIWSMHFVGMLACGLDVKITFDRGLTFFSAFVAILFTCAAFSSGYATETIENSAPAVTLSKWFKSFRTSLRSFVFDSTPADPETGYVPVATSDHGDEDRRSVFASTSDRGDDDGEENEDRHSAERFEQVPTRPTLFRNNSLFTGELPHPAEGSHEGGLSHVPEATPQTTPAPPTVPASEPLNPLRRLFASWSFAARPSPPEEIPSSTRTSEDSTPLTTSSSDESTGTRRPSGSASSGTHTYSHTSTTLSSLSWTEPLHAGLSREARLRIKAQARDKPVPKFGWKYWLKAYYRSITLMACMRATIWGLAIVFMHYCGMWAMEIPEGHIEWNWTIVILSYVVAFSVCFVACISMVHMEVHFGRQVAFSTIASVGTSSMHYTGMAAATFYTRAPPSPDAGYPEYLPFAILVIAVFVCVVSNAVLAHSAIISRNRMAEVILTKRRFWRIMAEKEAAEQANELKQQFISVASHEIRTPLHAVNGYCELLAMTNLTEEQAVYVNSIQQACHAINVIAGNVLDFSKLDRNNVELSARPVLIDLRKMVEDQARIIETRDASNRDHNVEVVVFVDNDVPRTMYLDETYTYRILMNLLSNAQKFCEEGYVCVHVAMESDTQVAIKIMDTGCGIPKSFRSALFQPFRQADSSLTRPKQGTGLGLSIVKHLVQRMSGEVDVESAEGEGSTFTVKLPVTPPSNSPMRPTLPLEVKKRVKIIHRHERTTKLFVDLWSRHGFSASRLSSDLSLQQLAQETDVVWTDVKSVQQHRVLCELMNGSEVLKLPAMFIVYSDLQELSVLEPALSHARNVVLTKRPVVTHNLLEMLQNPEPHMGSHVSSTQSRVRFALPEGKYPITPTEERKEESLVPTPSSPLSPPLSQPPSSPLGAERSVAPVVEPSSAALALEETQRILLVEDNMVNQHLGKRLLEKLGYAVETASNGQEAVEKASQSRYFCCFMDCQMPVLDGFMATQKIRELENNGTIHGRLPIIALTANVSTESEEKCRAAGMDHFLPKPFRMHDLQSALAHAQNASSPG
ncbi:uncharacterized protein PHACADRAFT_248203 [Phanerochaete carnosa HHB-10118-sp]|uniref:Histidine kinase n=1 Tax=Phanerochaete carnosa (strain HHB-10118-sp) TaxID=650164 RepID=K5WPY2_PHACS|nr:uncharacterized protein PHACADRAFT_248203 [Phanerochaete carnosa HHB-10118-sp]EKM61530.1 hypothetical protein PHACADRAFT_248203 [Phanerochaete carnosa HHB-10118-sp]